MEDIWLSVVKAHFEFCCVDEKHPLDGVTVRLRYSSRQEPYLKAGTALHSVLSKLGAKLSGITDIHEGLQSEMLRPQVEAIDEFIMIAGTAGVSGEAIELAHEKIAGGEQFKDRMHVIMPKAYENGFIKKRLAHHQVSTELFGEPELANGEICRRTLDKLVSRKRQRMNMAKLRENEFKPSIGIVVALPVEYEAVVALLGDLREQRERLTAGTYKEYTHGTIASYDGKKHQVVVSRVDKGNNRASVLTERMIADFGLDEVIMVGVAAGIPQTKKGQQDVRLGDVVVSSEMGVIQYDMKKETSSGIEHNHAPRPPSQAWLQRATGLLSSETEKARFVAKLGQLATGKFARPAKDVLNDAADPTASKPPKRIRNPNRVAKQPMLHQGPVGSANTVLKTAADREELREKLKLLAVEMEASGVAEAAMQNGKGYFVVRGICDYANDAKDKKWQPYAAMAAAAFAVTLVETMPTISSHETAKR